MLYDEGGDDVDDAVCFERVRVKEVADDDGGHHHEYLGDGDVEVADHVQLGEGVLGVGPDLLDRPARRAEGVTVHDRSDVRVFAEGAAPDLLAAGCLLLAAVEEGDQALGDEGEDPPVHYGAVVDE